MSAIFLREFFFWCMIINSAMFILYFVFIRFGHDWVYKNHSAWYPMSVEKFYIIHYSVSLIYKTSIMFFNVIPWLALKILTNWVDEIFNYILMFQLFVCVIILERGRNLKKRIIYEDKPAFSFLKLSSVIERFFWSCFVNDNFSAFQIFAI